MIPKNYLKNISIIPSTEGLERREELAEDIIRKGTHLPRGVMLEDIDRSVVDFIRDELSVVINGEKIPVILLTIQRWAEFSQTWEFTDEFKNIKIPFITVVRQPDVQEGTNQDGLWNIPGKPMFTHVKVPTWNGNRVGMSLYKIPQPTSVDVTYDVRLFTSRMRDLNKFSVKTQKKFNARQCYIWPNKHPQPLHLEGVSDESTIDDFENRRFYIQNYEFLLKAYILDEDDFVIEPAIDRSVIKMGVIDKNIKPSLKIRRETQKHLTYNIIMKPWSDGEFTITLSYDINFTDIVVIKNLNQLTLTLDDHIVTAPFIAKRGQKLNIRANRDISKMTKFIMNGYLF